MSALRLLFGVLSVALLSACSPSSLSTSPTPLPTPATCKAEELLRRHQSYVQRYTAAEDTLAQSTARTFMSALDKIKAIRTEYQNYPVHDCAKEMKAQLILAMEDAIEGHTIAYDALIAGKTDKEQAAVLYQDKLQKATEHLRLAVLERQKLEATIGWMTPTPTK